jgi:pimeloyl-ACP methyl ester carboxylesterase
MRELDELVGAGCERLGKTKVGIFGHSWGYALGVLYAARFPEKVAAYVGSGQIGDWASGESASYAFALAEAQRRGKRRAVSKLRAIGRPPHTAKSLWTQRTDPNVSRASGSPRSASATRDARSTGPASCASPSSCGTQHQP